MEMNSEESIMSALYAKIATHDDYEMYDYVNTNYKAILYALYSKKSKYHNLITNSYLLSILNQVFNGTISIDPVYKTYLDSILYYIIVNTKTTDYIRKLAFMVGESANKQVVKQLESLDVFDSEMCIFLAITLYSSLNDKDRIRKFNFTIATYTKSVSVENIIRIYAIFFSKNFSVLFVNSMFDTTIKDAIEKEEKWITDTLKVNDKNMETALMFILNSLEFASAKSCLQSFYNEYANRSYNSDLIRFRFTNCDAKYQNIHNVLNAFASEGIMIP